MAKKPKLKDEYTENDNYRYSELKGNYPANYEHYNNIQLRFAELAGNFGLTDFSTIDYYNFEVIHYHSYQKDWIDEELECRGLPPFQLLPLREQIRIKNLLLEYLETDYLVKRYSYPTSAGTKIIIRLLEDIYQNLSITRNKEKDE